MTSQRQEKAARKLRRATECERLGRHFYTRDYILGFWPVGEPYCLWCGSKLLTFTVPDIEDPNRLQ